MKNAPNSNFNDRLKVAAQARKAVMDRVKTMPKADDPELVAKKAEIAANRRAREEEAASRRKVEAEAKAAETARLAAEKAEKAAVLEADQKAARDARYAARKARTQGK